MQFEEIEEILESTPDVQEHAIEQHEKEEQEEVNKLQQFEDQAKEKFNPELHRQDSEGNPVLTQAGKFAKKRGKKKDSTSTLNAATNNLNANSMPTEQGTQLANSFYAVNTFVFAEDALPKSEQEHTAIVLSLQRFSDATGQQEMPWQIDLALCMGGYYMARFTDEKHLSKFEKLVLGSKAIGRKVKGWFVKDKKERKQ